jgi:hypothetical protein
MVHHRIVRKIGSPIGIGLIFSAQAAMASSAIQFSAQLDRTKVSVDDTVSLNLLVKSDTNVQIDAVQFRAPQFEKLQEFRSLQSSSTYDSNIGRFSTVIQQQLTTVLQPTEVGKFTITNIEAKIGGQTFHAPNLNIEVLPGGAGRGKGGAPGFPSGPKLNPRMFGGPLGQNPPAPSGRRVSGSHAFVKAEVNKQSAFKGEQLIVSYYLYHQMKVFNIQVDKFPVLSGFLREDLDLPVMGQRLETETVTVNGVPYQRALLAKYAAYPLQEGRLNIDSMSLKYHYYNNTAGEGLDEEDPFFGFFQQLTPRMSTSQSEQVAINVFALPEQGKPTTFTGGVGQFDVIGTVDKTEVRANEALTLVIKVEGQGNIATIQEPKIQWPDSIDLYDTKGKALSSKGGTGEKVFEILLIPRAPGDLMLPKIDFSFFDPAQKEYYTKSVDPIQIKVLDPAPGSSLVARKGNETSKAQADGESASKKDGKPTELKGLRPPSQPNETGSKNIIQYVWRFFYFASSLAFFGLVGLVIFDFFKKRTKFQARTFKNKKGTPDWKLLQEKALSAAEKGSLEEVTAVYVQVSDQLLSSLGSKLKMNTKGISREELKARLVDEQGVDPAVWDRAAQVFDYADMIRFASSAGAVAESQARQELVKWTSEAEQITGLL